MIIMLICGLWHGAGWTFVIWGGVHGLYIVINHLWLTLRRHWGHDLAHPTWVRHGTGPMHNYGGPAVLYGHFPGR